MITAVDTNVFIALWSGTAEAASAARHAFETASETGTFLVAPPVYAELIAAPKRTRDDVDTFLAQAQISVIGTLSKLFGSLLRSHTRHTPGAGVRNEAILVLAAFWLIL